jgi:hypothetical protein
MYSEKSLSVIEKTLDSKIIQAQTLLRKNINEWFSFAPISVYMIIGDYHRLGDPEIVRKPCIVVSSISANDNKIGKGYFKAFMSVVIKLAKKHGYRIVFESVDNPQLKAWLIQHGYTYVGYVENYYKDF